MRAGGRGFWFILHHDTSLSFNYRVKTTQRFSAAARRPQPPQGRIPTEYVARLITSPRPISSSLTNPGQTNAVRLTLLLLPGFAC